MSSRYASSRLAVRADFGLRDAGPDRGPQAFNQQSVGLRLLQKRCNSDNTDPLPRNSDPSLSASVPRRLPNVSPRTELAFAGADSLSDAEAGKMVACPFKSWCMCLRSVPFGNRSHQLFLPPQRPQRFAPNEHEGNADRSSRFSCHDNTTRRRLASTLIRREHHCVIISTPVRAIPRVIVQQAVGYTTERQRLERELLDRSINLPLPQRAEWQRAHGVAESVMLVLRNDDGEPVHALAAGIAKSRALPGHRVYRVQRLGSGGVEADAALISALESVVRQDPLALRVSVEVFERNSASRRHLIQALSASGFNRSERPRMYTHTLALDLGQPQEVLLAGLKQNTRRKIRLPERRGLKIMPVLDPALAPRLLELTTHVFESRQAAAPALPWDRIIEFSASQPALSRVVGLFHPSSSGSDQLVAFAWGCSHGSYATYEAGASTAQADLRKIPLSYAPIWDLIVWAKTEASAEWFDLGGVSFGQDGDARDGISEFKRHLSEDLIEVGDEWTLEPHPARATLAVALGRAAQWAAALRK